MKREHIIGIVLGFLAGNLTGTLATVAVFGADVRELKVEIREVKRRVAVIENRSTDIEQAGTPRGDR